MTDVGTHHQPGLAHHVRQGVAWLSASGEGENTAALSYAAFELRFAVERLAVHYWATLLDRKPEEQDLREIESFKRIERRRRLDDQIEPAMIHALDADRELAIAQRTPHARKSGHAA